MRNMLAAAALILAVTPAACGGDSKTSEPAAKPATPSASATASAKPATAVASAAGKPSVTADTPGAGATGAATTGAAAAATSQPQGDAVEVTGIVGGVSLSGKVIEIKRLQGAAVTQVSVDGTTVMHKAGGGTIQLKDIRTSDRIIAKGKLNDRRDALAASEITVQDVIPGAQPGG